MERQEDREAAKSQSADGEVKVVAEMPQDEKIRAEMKEIKEHDGYEGSCGGV